MYRARGGVSWACWWAEIMGPERISKNRRDKFEKKMSFLRVGRRRTEKPQRAEGGSHVGAGAPRVGSRRYASELAVSAILEQPDDASVFHPVAFE